MSRLTVHTHLPAAAKIVFEIEDSANIKFVAVGGGDGVPPGVQVMDGERVLFWCGAQDFGVAIVDENGKVTVDSASA